MRGRSYILRTLARWATLTALLAGGLFLTAGTTHIAMLRAYIAVFSTLLLATMLVVQPELARERAHPPADATDSSALAWSEPSVKGSILASVSLFLILGSAFSTPNSSMIAVSRAA
jgi:hypothetical protein